MRRFLLVLPVVLAWGCSNSVGGAPADTTSEGGGDRDPTTTTDGDAGADTDTAATDNDPPPIGEVIVPDGHPRLWWTEDRLAAGRAWFATHAYAVPTAPTEAPRVIDAALHTLLSGEPTGCERAVAWAMARDIDCPGVSCDPARWDGEAAIVVFDWCYDFFDATSRALFISRWNDVVDTMNAKPWGGVGMEGNNYYLGYLRNTIEWAIASSGDNPEAERLLAYALDERWRDSLLPYLAHYGAGGVPHEGSAYGRRTFGYLTIPLRSLALAGRDLTFESDYFLATAFWSIYATTPGPTSMVNGASVYETFPFNEDERWLERDISAGNTAQTSLGSYLVPLATRWSGAPVAGYIKSFLSLTGHAIDDRFVAASESAAFAGVASRPLSQLPLDYVAHGLGMFYTKTSWNADATLVNVQMGTPVAVGHEHADVGGFQIWRGGRWLSRETVGYAQNIAGLGGTGLVDCGNAVAHNAILFNGRGPVGYRRGAPTITRLASTEEYSFVAADLTDAYELTPEWEHREAEAGNPYVVSIVRELLFVRPLETLVVLDRLQVPTADVTTSFIAHFEVAPAAPSPATYAVTHGGQSLRVTTVLPASTTRRIVDEGGAIGQYRAEIETTGATSRYFLHVAQAGPAGGEAVTVDMSQTADVIELTLVSPSRGSAVVRFAKGMQSAGGAFGFATSGSPSTEPLRAGVQAMRITTEGPSWSP